VPSGLWKRTETTDSLLKETWFDAFWRPILDRESASDSSTTATFWRRGFDHCNRQTFAAYPLAALSGSNYLNATVGTTSTFDALDRTVSVVAAAEAPHNSVTTSFFYDTNFVTRVRDARNFETSTSFLAWDTPSTEFPTSIVAPEGQTTTILRDLFGKPRKLTRSGIWNGNPIAVDRDYVYDTHQRLCKTIEPESKATVVDYDSVNQIAWTAIGQNLLSLSDCERGSVSAAQKSTHSYDAMNRLLAITHPAGTASVGYSYFADGALQTASYGAGVDANTWTYAYNKRRLLESETLSYDSRSFVLDWSYNTRGQMAALTYPGGASVDWNPDARGRPRQAVGATSYATVNSRHANGAIASMTNGNGLSLSTTQNTRQLPATRSVGSLMNHTLTYDRNANLQGITDAIGSETRTLVYDGLNRMTQANAPAIFGNETYVYDALDKVRSASFGSTATFTHLYDA